MEKKKAEFILERREGSDRRTKRGARKKPFFAFLISLVIPGSGQIYNRELLKGFIVFSLAILSFVFFIRLQILYHDAYNQIIASENVKMLAKLYAQEQVKIWLRLIPLIFYSGIAIFSATDAYFFARYLVRIVPQRKRTEK